jgi:hypothetical protein
MKNHSYTLVMVNGCLREGFPTLCIDTSIPPHVVVRVRVQLHLVTGPLGEEDSVTEEDGIGVDFWIVDGDSEDTVSGLLSGRVLPLEPPCDGVL